jgi:ACS family glucarate transporter-like MFS transporter
MHSAARVTGAIARPATNVRWLVVAYLFLFSFLTIVDRVAISAAKNDMAVELGIPDVTFGFIFGVFALGYALFQIPAGWCADRYGPRLFLALIVVLWSLFTGLTGLAAGSAMLIVIRFLFGGAEAGIYPTASRAIYNWIPVQQRGAAQGLLFVGSRLGAAFGLSVVSFTIAQFGWRESFWTLGAIGIVLAAVWYAWFRDQPEEKNSVSASEVEFIRAAARAQQEQAGASEGWRQLLLSRNSGLLMAQYFASNFTFFIAFSWLLPYLKAQYRLSATEAGAYASVPLYFGAFGNWFSGAVVDAIYRKGRWRMSRLAPALAGFGLAAVSLVAGASMPGVTGAVICFSLATLGVDMTLSPSWTACQDIAGARTGSLSGAMNMMGNLGSFISSVTFPALVAATGTAATYFYVAAAINVLAMLCWWRIRPGRT